MKMNLRMVNKL